MRGMVEEHMAMDIFRRMRYTILVVKILEKRSNRI